MLRNNRFSVVFVIIFILTMIFVFISSNKKTNLEIEKIYLEYPLITKKDSINNVIKEKFHPIGFRTSPNIAFILFDNGQKFRIQASLISDTGINDKTFRNCLLIKKANNDTLSIFYNQDYLGLFILE